MQGYEDIINLPHHVSKKHPQMTMYQRAAQFAPFAALVGHDRAIDEAARENTDKYSSHYGPEQADAEMEG